MRLFPIALAALAVVALAAFPAAAQTAIEKRQERQEQRIENGIESGQLTEKEAARLEKRQDEIEADKQKALEDGKGGDPAHPVTPGETRGRNHPPGARHAGRALHLA